MGFYEKKTEEQSKCREEICKDFKHIKWIFGIGGIGIVVIFIALLVPILINVFCDNGITCSDKTICNSELICCCATICGDEVSCCGDAIICNNVIISNDGISGYNANIIICITIFLTLIVLTTVICLVIVIKLKLGFFYRISKDNKNEEIINTLGNTYMNIFRPGYVHVHFRVTSKDSDCNEIYIVGSCNELGNWEPSCAKKIELKEGKGCLDIWLPSGHIEYKLIKFNDSTPVWEHHPNKTLALLYPEQFIEREFDKSSFPE